MAPRTARWEESLATGVEEIDDQHRELFQHINQLLQGMNQGRAQEEVGELLVFMEKYARHHFASEERLMQEYQYPHLERHRQEHKRFVQEVERLKQHFEESGPSVSFVLAVQKKVLDWLHGHIRRADHHLGKYLQEKG